LANRRLRVGLQSAGFARMMLVARLCSSDMRQEQTLKRGRTNMNTTVKFALGVLTALAMLLLTFLVPRGGSLRDAQLVQFPVTVGVWAIFVLLFVKLK
jgi:hypothetical protein